MNKKVKYFSLKAANDKITVGNHAAWLEDLRIALGYQSVNTVYKILRMPGRNNMDIECYRRINVVLAKYGLSEDDWTVTEMVL